MLVNYLAATCWILIGIMNYPIYRRGDYPSWFVFYMAIFSAFLVISEISAPGYASITHKST